MSTVPALQPDELEVLQTEQDGPDPVVRVCVADIDVPVRVQNLPRKAGATVSRTYSTTPTRILGPDHRRAQATLVSVGQNMLITFSASTAQDPSRMALWPANVPLIITNDSEVWVAAATATTVISALSEMWATG